MRGRNFIIVRTQDRNVGSSIHITVGPGMYLMEFSKLFSLRTYGGLCNMHVMT